MSMKRVISLTVLISLCVLLTGCRAESKPITAESFVKAYEAGNASGYSYVSDYSSEFLCDSDRFLYDDICFSSENVTDSSNYDFSAASVACFDVSDSKVLYSKDVFSKVYPASTTKLLTALVAAKYSDPDDMVEIKEDNCGISIKGAQLCGFMQGDTVSMRDLLYCLLVVSGNDAAIAIAEHISGSVEQFAKLMNEEASRIGATDTHFTNPHGLHDPNHYTTAYDIYLIFREAISFPYLKEIMSSSNYTATIYGTDGTERYLQVESTNMYKRGIIQSPDGITVLFGKTGETIAAGNCLVLYSEDDEGHGYITELFKSADRQTVYSEMNILLELCH